MEKVLLISILVKQDSNIITNQQDTIVLNVLEDIFQVISLNWPNTIIAKKMEIFNITISGIGDIPVSADSWEEAEEIVQAYIDKRSLDWVITYG